MKDIMIGNERFLGEVTENDIGEKVVVGIKVSGTPMQGDVLAFVKAENVGRLSTVTYSGPTSVAVRELKPQVARYETVVRTVKADVDAIHLQQHQNYKLQKAMEKIDSGAPDFEDEF